MTEMKLDLTHLLNEEHEQIDDLKLLEICPDGEYIIDINDQGITMTYYQE